MLSHFPDLSLLFFQNNLKLLQIFLIQLKLYPCYRVHFHNFFEYLIEIEKIWDIKYPDSEGIINIRIETDRLFINHNKGLSIYSY